MTGAQFQKHIEEDTPYSQRQLADRWGVSHTTIQRKCDAEEVPGLYADAMRLVVQAYDDRTFSICVLSE